MATKEGFWDKILPRTRSNFVIRIVVPAALSIVLFILALFLILIPSVERHLMDGKKETAQELTRAAVSVIDEYYKEEQAGQLSRAEAQAQAVERIRLLRYGDENKDYFWITDTHPTMIVHPYLPELDGQDLTNYEDSRGKKLFVDFVAAVQETGSGWVDYYWQWKDDPNRIVPKISYVQLFAPWNWVIGTGIYVDDVEAAIGKVQRNITYICIVIAVVVALLLFYGARQSLKIDRRRTAAEQALSESNEKYRALVEAATEGLVMVLGGKCAYSNQPFLDMLGYNAEELQELDVNQLFVAEGPTAEQTRAMTQALAKGEPVPPTLETTMRTKDGRAVEVLLATTPISLAGREGHILISRSLTRQKAMEVALEEQRRQFRTMSDALTLGVFRSGWGRKAPLIEANPAMRRLLHLPASADLVGVDWLERIIDPAEREALVNRLNMDKEVQDYRLEIRREDGGRTDVSLFAVLVNDDKDNVAFCDGIIEDITMRKKSEEERDALIAQLQASLFYLQEPITHATAPAITVDMGQSITRAAQLMAKNLAGAVLIIAPDGELVGIVTDHDFRHRVVAEGVDPSTPIRSIMSAPVASIPAQAPIYEALLRMQERAIDHLAVLDEKGKYVGVVRLRDLVHYQRSSSVIITDSIHRARSVDDIIESHDRLPALVKAVIDSGAATRHVNRIITSVSDSIVQRLVQMAVEQLGPPPSRFAFLALGSEGREEQTLLTDQDNALLYDDPAPDKTKEASEYFLAMGTLVCDWLAKIGYKYCDGGVMAKNPRWNLPRSIWREQFSHWIHNADPQELLELNMLFDFRCVSGEQQFARELRTWVFDQMEDYPLFYLHFAQNALLYKPPLGLFGNIQTTSTGTGPKGLSLKETLMPVVNFTRLYALRHRIDSTNTLDRLHELYDRGMLSRDSFEELVPDYEFVMRMRIRRQALAIGENREPSNIILPEEWTSAEEAKLKRLMEVAGDLRKKISFDFLGGIAGF